MVGGDHRRRAHPRRSDGDAGPQHRPGDRDDDRRGHRLSRRRDHRRPPAVPGGQRRLHRLRDLRAGARRAQLCLPPGRHHHRADLVRVAGGAGRGAAPRDLSRARNLCRRDRRLRCRFRAGRAGRCRVRRAQARHLDAADRSRARQYRGDRRHRHRAHPLDLGDAAVARARPDPDHRLCDPDRDAPGAGVAGADPCRRVFLGRGLWSHRDASRRGCVCALDRHAIRRPLPVRSYHPRQRRCVVCRPAGGDRDRRVDDSGPRPSANLTPALNRLVGVFGGVLVVSICQPLLAPLVRRVIDPRQQA
jgi:hypothetical protein